mmetsp:Transcript_2445/g.3823  ORF Transcript_2445/g.3823 Transcript_2445/m.3823 type:complete len:239 (+) Transcript_2445:88-804(+)
MEPIEFLEEASQQAFGDLDSTIDELKQEIQSKVNRRGSKEAKESYEDEIESSCNAVKGLLEDALRKNMEKFGIYAMRNIFVPSTSNGSGSSTSSTAVATTTSAIASVDDELHELRKAYVSLQAELRALDDNVQASDLLLKDMRATMFSLRVGAQAFDDADVHPLPETVANISRSRDKLVTMCQEATGIISSLGQASGGVGQGQAMEIDGAEDIMEDAPEIQTRDLDDIMMLSKSLQRK